MSCGEWDGLTGSGVQTSLSVRGSVTITATRSFGVVILFCNRNGINNPIPGGHALDAIRCVFEVA